MNRSILFLLSGLVMFTLASCQAPPPGMVSSGASRSGSQYLADAVTSQRVKAAPAAEARPGLGTEWGPERDSSVTTIRFSRDSSRPLAVAAIHYNDAGGAKAMAAASGRSSSETSALRTVEGGLASLSVVDSHGDALPAWEVGDRLICVGEKGQHYSLRVQNGSDRRMEMVMTVDGLDVLDGQAGSFSKRGYILDPGESYRVEGWRMSDAKVASFRFSSVDSSYASLKHRDTRNVGVIGLAVFPEKGPRPQLLENQRRRGGANPFPGNRGRYATAPP